MNDLIKFDFNGSEISTITDDKGEPWFVAKDVCEVLGYSNPSKTVSDHIDEDERSNVSLDRGGSLLIINESGLYALIMKSRKPEAKTFRKWVTSEVLPKIRKTGGYSVKDPFEVLNDPAAMRGLLLTYTEKVLALEETVKGQAPKVAIADRIHTADGMTCITDTAKSLQVQPKDVFAWMSANRWIYRRPGGKGWIAYQDKIQQGLLTHKVLTVSTSDGREKVIENVLVTPKGLTRLAQAMEARQEIAA